MRLVVDSLVHRPWVAVLGVAHSLGVVLGRRALERVGAHRILVVVMVRGDIRLGVEAMAHGILWVVGERARRSSPAAEGVGRIGPGVDSGLVVEGLGVHRIAVEGREVVVGRRFGDNLGEEPRKVVLDYARQFWVNRSAGQEGGVHREGTHEIGDNET